MSTAATIPSASIRIVRAELLGKLPTNYYTKSFLCAWVRFVCARLDAIEAGVSE